MSNHCYMEFRNRLGSCEAPGNQLLGAYFCILSYFIKKKKKMPEDITALAIF